MMKITTPEEMKKINNELASEPAGDRINHLTDLHKADEPVLKRKRIKLIHFAHGFDCTAL